MAFFSDAYELTMKNEGGYVDDPDDLGGETYRGVSRRFHPNWEGWSRIDLLKTRGNFPKNLDDDYELHDMIKSFYEIKFWGKVGGNEIRDQRIAESLFDYAVNVGHKTCIRMVQAMIKTDVDGIIGPNTIRAINKWDAERFIPQFALMKIARYIRLVQKRPVNKKFFYAWVKRSLEGV